MSSLIQKNLLDKLPEEIHNLILFFSIGSHDLDTYNKKKSVNKEIALYMKEENFYLTILDNYEKTPELYMDLDDYIFANRIPKLLFD
jgi:hypothetical protein